MQGDQAFAGYSSSSTSSGTSAVSATGGGTNATTSQGVVNVPVETNQFSHGLDFSNVILYLNSSALSLKGTGEEYTSRNKEQFDIHDY